MSTARAVARDRGRQAEVGGANRIVDLEATMDADLDLLCISVYCTADDLLPEPTRNARRKLTDAEVVTLCVAQVLMGIPSDRRFLRAARRQLGHLFPSWGTQIRASCRSGVFVDKSTEAVASPDLVGRIRADDV
jgi:hypothetical protein